MKNKYLLVIAIVLLLFAAFTACGENSDPADTTDLNSAINDTTEITNQVMPTMTDVTVPGGEVISHPEFNEMDHKQQQEVIESFENIDQFKNWYEEVKNDYEEYTQPTVESTTETTEPEGTVLPTPTGVTVPDKDEVTFMDYHQMSGDEQLAFINSFSSPNAFAAWHAAARDAYNETMIEIDDTKPIDLGDLVNGN